MQCCEDKCGSNGIQSSFTKNFKQSTIFYSKKRVIKVNQHQHENKNALEKTSPHCDCVRTIIEGRSSLIRQQEQIQQSFFTAHRAHRAPHIMALNVTQMRIAHLFSLTMTDDECFDTEQSKAMAGQLRHYRALHYSNRTTPRRRHHRRHCTGVQQSVDAVGASLQQQRISDGILPSGGVHGGVLAMAASPLLCRLSPSFSRTIASYPICHVTFQFNICSLNLIPDLKPGNLMGRLASNLRGKCQND